MTNNPPNYKDSKILLIDNDSTNSNFVEQLLKNEGYQKIKSVLNVREAPQTYLDYNPDLVLLDLEIPHEHCLAIFEQLQAMNTKSILPTILMMEADDTHCKCEALNLGIQHVIEKPINHNILLATIRNMLRLTDSYNKTHSLLSSHMQKTEQKLIESLLLSIKLLGQETERHIQRVSEIVYILATGLNLDEANARSYAKASQLHDIGKTHIPPEILKKPARLDADEWEIMKQHTLLGEQILKSFQGQTIHIASIIARTHHENWDGTGYPCRLSKNRIHLAGRLTAIADVFDALLMKRPYKEAWRLEDAIDYIKAESGKKFDPAIVNVFVHQLGKIIALYN